MSTNVFWNASLCMTKFTRIPLYWTFCVMVTTLASYSKSLDFSFGLDPDWPCPANFLNKILKQVTTISIQICFICLSCSRTIHYTLPASYDVVIFKQAWYFFPEWITISNICILYLILPCNPKLQYWYLNSNIKLLWAQFFSCAMRILRNLQIYKFSLKGEVL